jgi:hypothetical protein
MGDRPAERRARVVLERLFDSGEGADAFFQSAAGGRVFRLHRLILSQSSPVLATMLSSAFKEGNRSGPSSPIVIGEVSPRVLGAFFGHLYAVDLPPAADAAFFCEVWEVAHRFEVADLEDAARAHTRTLLPRQPLAAFAVLAVARALRDAGMVGMVRSQLARDLDLLARCSLLVELTLEDMQAVLARTRTGEAGALLVRFEVCMRWVDGDVGERAELVDRLFLFLDLSGATVQEVETIAARPAANTSSVLMCKIVDRFARERQESRRLERRVDHLEERKTRKERDEVELTAHLKALQAENAALRASLAAAAEQAQSNRRLNVQADGGCGYGGGFGSYGSPFSILTESASSPGPSGCWGPPPSSGRGWGHSPHPLKGYGSASDRPSWHGY